MILTRKVYNERERVIQAEAKNALGHAIIGSSFEPSEVSGKHQCRGDLARGLRSVDAIEGIEDFETVHIGRNGVDAVADDSAVDHIRANGAGRTGNGQSGHRFFHGKTAFLRQLAARARSHLLGRGPVVFRSTRQNYSPLPAVKGEEILTVAPSADTATTVPASADPDAGIFYSELNDRREALATLVKAEPTNRNTCGQLKGVTTLFMQCERDAGMYDHV